MSDIAKVSAALVKAQRGFAPALKSSTNPHFRSKYADLAACIESVIDALNANGIALIQKQHPCEGGVAVETVFVHESGETLSSGVLQVPASKQDPQGYGSALTYARRYSLMAACGHAPEDDDGNAAKRKTEDDQYGQQGALTMFAPQAQAAIRRAAAAAIAAFDAGNEWGAFEEVMACVDSLAKDDSDKANQVKLAFNAIFKPHSALRASLKRLSQQEHAKEHA